MCTKQSHHMVKKQIPTGFFSEQRILKSNYLYLFTFLVFGTPSIAWCKERISYFTINNIQVRPSVQGNIQICQPEGKTAPQGLTNLDVSLHRGPQLFYYIFANVLQVISLVGKNWVVRRGTIGLFPGSAHFANVLQVISLVGGNWVVRRGKIYNYSLHLR